MWRSIRLFDMEFELILIGPRNFANGFCSPQSLTNAANAVFPLVFAFVAAFSMVGRHLRTRALMNQ
jgi:hypothetical protein